MLGLGDITIKSFIMILKCYDNQYQREILSIIILLTQYITVNTVIIVRFIAQEYSHQ